MGGSRKDSRSDSSWPLLVILAHDYGAITVHAYNDGQSITQAASHVSHINDGYLFILARWSIRSHVMELCDQRLIATSTFHICNVYVYTHMCTR